MRGLRIGGVALGDILEIRPHHGRCVSLVFLVVGLILKKDEFIGFVIRGIVCKVRHRLNSINLKQINGFWNMI